MKSHKKLQLVDETSIDNQDENNKEKYRNKIQYEIRINQLGLLVTGLFDDIDIKDCIILDYIQHQVYRYSRKNSNQFITYNYLLQSLPILKKLRSSSIASISRVIKKLERCGLIRVIRKNGKSNKYQITELATDMLFCRAYNNDRETRATFSTREKSTYPALEKRSFSNVQKSNSIKDREINSSNIENYDSSEINLELKIRKYRDEALRYFQSLNPEEKRLFDSRAYSRLDFGCPHPKPNSEDMKTLRIKNYIYEHNL